MLTMPIYRLSVAQYHAMLRHGILTEDDRVELLNGWLVPKRGQNRHYSPRSTTGEQVEARSASEGSSYAV